jgi:hypothetical protein
MTLLGARASSMAIKDASASTRISSRPTSESETPADQAAVRGACHESLGPWWTASAKVRASSRRLLSAADKQGIGGRIDACANSDIGAGLWNGFDAHAAGDDGLTSERAPAVDHHQALLARAHQAEHATCLTQTGARAQRLHARGEQRDSDVFAGTGGERSIGENSETPSPLRFESWIRMASSDIGTSRA